MTVLSSLDDADREHPLDRLDQIGLLRHNLINVLVRQTVFLGDILLAVLCKDDVLLMQVGHDLLHGIVLYGSSPGAGTSCAV